jgi:hypothetical protein
MKRMSAFWVVSVVVVFLLFGAASPAAVGTLHVQKNIVPLANAAGSTATLSFVDQTAPQTALRRVRVTTRKTARRFLERNPVSAMVSGYLPVKRLGELLHN